MRGAIRLVAIFASIFSGLAYAAAPVITAPANGSYVAGSFTITYTTTDTVNPLVFGTLACTGSPAINMTINPPLTTGTITAYAGIRPISCPFALYQNGQMSETMYYTSFSLPNQGYPTSGSTLPPNQNLVIRYTPQFPTPVTTTLTGAVTYTDSSRSPTLVGSGYAVSTFTIPASFVTTTGTVSLKFTQNGYTSSFAFTFIIGNPTTNPIVISPVPNTILAPGQATNFTFAVANANDAACYTTGTTTLPYTPKLSASTYIVIVAVTASQLVSASGNFAVTCTQQIGTSYYSTIASYPLQGPITITGYNSAASTFAANALLLPTSIYASSTTALQYITFQLISTTSSAYSMLFTLPAALNSTTFTYTAGPFVFTNEIFKYPAAGTYTLKATANSVVSAGVSYTFTNPPAITISAPANGSTITSSIFKPLLISYTSPPNYVQPIVFSLKSSGGSVLDTTVTPVVTGGSNMVSIATSTLANGTYTLIGQQLDSLNASTGAVTISNLQLGIVPVAPIFLSPANGTLVANTVTITYQAALGANIRLTFTPSGTDHLPVIYEIPAFQTGSALDIRSYTASLDYPGDTYTLTMLQNSMTSYPLTIVNVGFPILDSPAPASYSPLGTDLVIRFHAYSPATLTVASTYNGQTVNDTPTLVAGNSIYTGSTTIPASHLTVPGLLSIVLSQNTFSSTASVSNIGSAPGAPNITTLGNNSYVPASTALTFSYTATNLSVVTVTAVPYNGDTPLTAYVNSLSPTLSGSVIAGMFTIPSSYIQSKIKITLTQGAFMSSPLTVYAAVAPSITTPTAGSKIGLNRALNVTFSSDTSLTGDVTVTLTKPDASTTIQSTTPIAGIGTVTFMATDIEQSGVYTLKISQATPRGAALNGLPVVVETGVIPTITGVLSGVNYTQNSMIAPVVNVPTIDGVTTVGVTITYQSFSQTQNYPLVINGDGTSTSYVIQLNNPYNFQGTKKDFAPLGSYSLLVNYNGVSSDPIAYALTAADAPKITSPATDEGVTVSAASPLTIAYDSPPNYNLSLTFALTKQADNPGRVRRADPITETVYTDDLETGGGTVKFEGGKAPTSSGTYVLSILQLAPDGSSINGADVTFPITINAASGAAGRARARKIRRLVRRSRCSSPETECPTASGSFECIDLTTELTSCGGCNPDNKSGSPFDCTSIRRAKGVGCDEGRCVVFSCEGFSYIPNDSQSACVRRR